MDLFSPIVPMVFRNTMDASKLLPVFSTTSRTSTIQLFVGARLVKGKLNLDYGFIGINYKVANCISKEYFIENHLNEKTVANKQ